MNGYRWEVMTVQEMEELLNEKWNYDTIMKLDDVYSTLSELTSGETDEELKMYYEYLLDSIQEAMAVITRLEKLRPKPNISLKEIDELNMKANNRGAKYEYR